MSKPLNFNNVEKKYLTVTLADEANTTLMIGTPTKRIMDELTLLKSGLKSVENDENDDAMDDLYLACANIMSRNKGGIIITKDKVADIFDLEDITIFFNAYMDFVTEIVNSKN